ncbi:MAG: riboflavin biosynthesis protein RibF [Planctomycetes bacterium]|nr:riboflavin biosynthesis protein RibF [Planctomycetota bacterium]
MSDGAWWQLPKDETVETLAAQNDVLAQAGNNRHRPMKVFHGFEEFVPPAAGVVLTIGNFDGLHRGHRRIIDSARTLAGQADRPLVALTFEPHPLAVVAPDRAPARLTTEAEKLALLASCGVDAAIVLRAVPRLLARTPAEFLTSLADRCRPRAIVEGATFNFGRARAGSVDTLRAHGQLLGFSVHVVETVRCDELPGAPAVNSSAIRAALTAGRIDVANALLGRPYRISGTVATGAGRGATLGYPTANLDEIPHLIPQHGVYAAAAQTDSGDWFLAAVNIGPQPTFDAHDARVEAFLLDYSGDLRSQRIALHFFARLRAQRRFSGPRELSEQISQDVANTRRNEAWLARLRSTPALPI